MRERFGGYSVPLPWTMLAIMLRDLIVVWDHSSLVGGVCEKTLQCNSLPDQDNDMVRETGLIVAWVEIDF